MSTPKNVLLIGLRVPVLGIVVLALSLPQSSIFRCTSDLSLKNSSLTQDQIIEYCNNQTIETEKRREVNLCWNNSPNYRLGNSWNWWLLACCKKKRKRITEGASSSLELGVEMMNNRRIGEDVNGEDYRFTPKKVYCFALL